MLMFICIFCMLNILSEMATINVQAARERTIGSRGALKEAFQQVMQGISHIQEAFLQQERRTEEKLSKIERTIREANAEQERRLQEERRTMEATLARVEEATSAFEDKLRRVEARVEALEWRFSPSAGQEMGEVLGVEDRLAHLEGQIEKLNASTKRDLQSALPRVDALLNHPQTPSPPVAPPHPTSTSSIPGASSAPPAPSSASVSSPAPRPRSPSARSAAPPPPLTPERRKELGEKLMEAAIWRGEADVFKLLDEGADVNYSDTRGQTPLFLAASSSHVNIISLLIRMGADVNAIDMRGDTALHFASNDKSGRCTSLLIRAGAMVDTQNKLGQTPLHLAASAGNQAAALALFAAGASKNVGDERGRRPWDYADNFGRVLYG